MGTSQNLERKGWTGTIDLEMRGHPGCVGPSRHLLLGDPRLLLAVPLVIMQTHSIPVKQVQVVDSHLRGRDCELRSGTAHTPGFQFLVRESSKQTRTPPADSPELFLEPVTRYFRFPPCSVQPGSPAAAAEQ